MPSVSDIRFICVCFICVCITVLSLACALSSGFFLWKCFSGGLLDVLSQNRNGQPSVTNPDTVLTTTTEMKTPDTK